MKAVFVHDHKFRRIDGKIYSPGGLPDNVLSRYVNYFGSLTVVGRVIDEETVNSNYSLILNPNVKIVTKSELESEIKAADRVVVRLPSINGYKAVWLAQKYKKPLMLEVVGCTLDAYWNYGIKGKTLALPAYLLMRLCVRNAHYVVYVTSKFLQKRYPCKGKSMAISDVAIQPITESVLEKRLEKIGNNSDVTVMGTAGAIDVEYKGQEFVIRAIPEIMKRTGKIVRYELAGSGNPDRLKKIAEECGVSENVVFKGVINHEMMNDWLDSLDIYLQPSMLEGLSRAIVEAMSRGLPCAASKCGGNPELIEDAYLFRKNSKQKLPMFICDSVVNIEENIADVAKRNFNFANTQYSSDVLNLRRDEFYNEFAMCK